MKRIATSFGRLIGTVATGALVVASAALAASSVDRSSLDIAAISSSWQVDGFPSVRLFGAFGSVLDDAIREDAETAGSLPFTENRMPSWVRPQPQPKALVGDVSGSPSRLFLEQNYPNPFNPSTMIRYGVPAGMRVKLTVHTLLGSQIRTLVDQWQEAGTYTFDFIGADLPSGAYFYRLQTDVGTITRRMIISK
jgi:hypothetical protein